MQAVLEIAGEDGWHGLTMRKIAERIRYSAPMIYEVFDSKDDICGELVEHGYQLLYRHMSASAAGLSDPARRLWALLQAFRSFAWANPAYYQAMFGMAPLARPGEEYRKGDYAGACLGLIGDALLQSLAAQGEEQLPLSPLDAARAVTLAAHGAVSGHLSGLLPNRADAEALYDQILQGLLTGWGL
jgi:AcrR family transcriptional regulator